MPDDRPAAANTTSAPWKGERKILCVKEAAKYLNVHKSVLDKWRTRKPEPYGPPFLYVGAKKVGYPADLLDAWVQAQLIRPRAR